MTDLPQPGRGTTSRLAPVVSPWRRAGDWRRRTAGRLRPGRFGESSPSAPRSAPKPSTAQAPTVTPVVPQGVPPATRSATGQPAGGAPRTGGTLIVAKSTEATDLDPQLTASLARQRITMLTYSNLVKLSNDLVIPADLAETWKVSPDGKQIDFTLRQGVLWHPPVSRELTGE